jgi:hypothetical protein
MEAWQLETHTGPVLAGPIRCLDYLNMFVAVAVFILLPSGAAVPGRLTKPMASVSVLLSSWALSCPPSLDNTVQGPGECQCAWPFSDQSQCSLAHLQAPVQLAELSR